MNILNKINLNFLLAVFAFSMPIHEKISTIMIFVCVLALSIEIAKKRVVLEWKKEFLVLPVLYLFYIGISIIMSDKIEFKWFEQKASLLIFPFLFLTSYKIDFRRILTAFVYGCLLAYIICFIFALKNSILIESDSIGFNPLLNDSRGFGFFKSTIYEGNYFFGEHFSILMQISYFALYLTFALFILLFYLKEFKGKGFVISILVLGVLQTISLAGILDLVLVSFFLLNYKVKSLRTKIVVIVGFVGIIALSGVYHPRINVSLKSVFQTLQGENSVDFPKLPRLSTWEGSLKVINEHQFGLGIRKAQEQLNIMYDKIGFIRREKKELNAHNQFFQTILECGIIGLFVLLYAFYYLYRNAGKLEAEERIIIYSFLTLLGMNFLFESMLNRYIGISFFTFFICLLFNLKKTRLSQI
ncbi:O-antigen ligase family protein [uncultured Aquimarina sp.]|uniref:O-antigen ligase family protein n=1 Tax=uncultured Aquimarina sp. TaxID=575652 RepID=UPI00262BA548|nr:O-antigen ligase family protein [uncultured Aquimarina sp.]